MFVNHSSAAEIGTTRASINRTGKTNAAKGVEMTGMQTICGKKLKQSIHTRYTLYYTV